MAEPVLKAVVEAALLYDTDTVLWSEEQAELLHQVADGNRPIGLDWANIIEEIESVGRSQINAVESLLLQILVHEFKALLWPDTPYVEGWRNEALIFQAQAAAQFTPSMRQRINIEKLLERATRAVPGTIDGNRPMATSTIMASAAKVLVQQWLDAPESGMFFEGVEEVLNALLLRRDT